MGNNVAESGINLPAGDGKVAFALRNEQGEAIANVLAQEDCNNHIYNFTGAEAYSYDNVAAALSELMHTTIKYNKIAPDVKLKNVACLSILRVTF